MATEKQILANNANGRLGHGATSFEGKYTCSGNAVKHGLTAKVHWPTEGRVEREAMRKELWEDFRPVGRTEEDLVIQFADSRLNLQRATALETGYHNMEMAIILRAEYSYIAKNAKELKQESAPKVLEHLSMLSADISQLQSSDEARMWSFYCPDIKIGHEKIDRILHHRKDIVRESRQALHDLQKLQALRRENEAKYGVANEIPAVTSATSAEPTSDTELQEDMQAPVPTKTIEEVIEGLSVWKFLVYMKNQQANRIKGHPEANTEEESSLMEGNTKEESSTQVFDDEDEPEPQEAADEESEVDPVEAEDESEVEPMKADDEDDSETQEGDIEEADR